MLTIIIYIQIVSYTCQIVYKGSVARCLIIWLINEWCCLTWCLLNNRTQSCLAGLYHDKLTTGYENSKTNVNSAELVTIIHAAWTINFTHVPLNSCMNLSSRLLSKNAKILLNIIWVWLDLFLQFLFQHG